MTPNQKQALKRRVDKLLDTAVEASWAGSQPPEIAAQIEIQFEKAKISFLEYLRSL